MTFFRQFWRWLPIALPFVVVGVFVVRGAESADVPNLTAPPGVTLPATAPTQPGEDLTGVQLAGVDGTTTTAPLRMNGSATLSGVVLGPDGPVGGATVRVERIDLRRGTDATANGDGAWRLSGISGGRYRVRAFLPPSFAETDAQIFFLGDNEQKRIDLHVQQFGAVQTSSAIAPDPPEVGRPANLVIRIVSRTVDSDGVVGSTGIAGATVAITSAGGFEIGSASTAVTNGSGDAEFSVTCTSEGASQFTISVTDGAAPPVGASVSVSDCVSPAPPPPPTTSSPPSTSSSSSSTSSSSPPPKPN